MQEKAERGNPGEERRTERRSEGHWRGRGEHRWKTGECEVRVMPWREIGRGGASEEAC
jgi:hypothetical protein